MHLRIAHQVQQPELTFRAFVMLGLQFE